MHSECHSIKSSILKFVSHTTRPNAFGVSFNLHLHSQSHWSLFHGTWQKRPRQIDHRMTSGKELTTLLMQQAVHVLYIHMRIHTLCANDVYIYIHFHMPCRQMIHVYLYIFMCIQIHFHTYTHTFSYVYTYIFGK